MRATTILLLSLSIARAERFPDGEKAFQAARALLQKEYGDQLTDEDLWRAATAGMVAGVRGREWDKLLSPSEMAELRGDLEGEVVGIGVEIKFDGESGITTVIAPIPGAPAAQAGIAAGDRILTVDGKSFKGRTLRDVVGAMRGRAGEVVRLGLLRDDRVIIKEVTRAKVVYAPVTETALPGNLAVVTVRAFTEKTPELFRSSLARVAARKPRGLLLDLRDDQGGMFEAMIECAGALLPKGTLVVTKVARGREENFATRTDPVLTGVPVVVLTNGATASGAEVLAAALRSGLRARLVGARTHGKWNVQKLHDLPNQWTMKYTVGVLRAPDGSFPDGKGVEPDLEVAMDAAAVARAQRLTDGAARLAADPALRTAAALLRP